MKKPIKGWLGCVCAMSMLFSFSGCSALEEQKLPELFSGNYQATELSTVKAFAEEVEPLVQGEVNEENIEEEIYLRKKLLLNNTGVLRKCYMQQFFKINNSFSLGGMQSVFDTKVSRTGLEENASYTGAYQEKGKITGLLNIAGKYLLPDEEIFKAVQAQQTVYDDGMYVYRKDGDGNKVKEQSSGALAFVNQAFIANTLFEGGVEYITLSGMVAAEEENAEYAWEMDKTGSKYTKIRATALERPQEDGVEFELSTAMTWIYDNTSDKCIAYACSVDGTGVMALDDSNKLHITVRFADYMMPYEGDIIFPDNFDEYIEKTTDPSLNTTTTRYSD